MKLDINGKKALGRTRVTWKLGNVLLKNGWVKQEIKEFKPKYMQAKEKENWEVQDLWHAAKVVLSGKSLARQAFIKKQKSSRHNLP